MNTKSLKLEYIDQYKKMRKIKSNIFPGISLTHNDNIKKIKTLIDETNSKTILDYGCGGGEQYTKLNTHKEWGVDMPTLYDPAVEDYSTLPTTTFDGIISTDVFEHIPEEVVPECLEWIYTHTKKFVYLGISTALAKKILPSGENARCTVKPFKWWQEQIKKYSSDKNITTELLCYGQNGKYTVFDEKESDGIIRF